MPILVEYPQNLTLKQGDTAWFACKTVDMHRTKIDWYFLNGTNPLEIETEDLQRYKKMINNNAVSFTKIYYREIFFFSRDFFDYLTSLFISVPLILLARRIFQFSSDA